MKQELARQASGILSPYDSCVVINFLDYISLVDPAYTTSNEGFEMTYQTCPVNNFSFSVIRNVKKGSYLFYGMFDVYHLRFWRGSALDSMQLIRFSNPGVGLIMNEYLALNADSTRKITSPQLRGFLYSLYFERFDNIYLPFFDRYLEMEDLRGYVSQETFAHIKREVSQNVIIFLDNDFGIIMFDWFYEGKTVKTAEYLIPFRKSKMLSWVDTPQDYELNCSGGVKE